MIDRDRTRNDPTEARMLQFDPALEATTQDDPHDPTPVLVFGLYVSSLDRPNGGPPIDDVRAIVGDREPDGTVENLRTMRAINLRFQADPEPEAILPAGGSSPVMGAL